MDADINDIYTNFSSLTQVYIFISINININL